MNPELTASDWSAGADGDGEAYAWPKCPDLLEPTYTVSFCAKCIGAN